MYALVLFAVLLASGRSGDANKQMRLLAELDNNIQHSAAPHAPRRFLSLTRVPPREAHAAGASLELTCEAIAAPAPSIRWFKNDQPVYEYNDESNEVFEPSPTSLAKLSSTLVVARAAAGDRYACVAAAGGRAARALTLVRGAGGGGAAGRGARGARVREAYAVLVEVAGGRARLPCGARGRPRPRVRWTTNRGAPARAQPRMKVLRSGALQIWPLRWSDMGEFRCVAADGRGRQLAATFVYPASASRVNKEKH